MYIYLTPALVEKVKEEKNLIPAIRIFRDETHRGGIVLGLRECKDIVKAIHKGEFVQTNQGKNMDEVLVEIR